MTEDQLRELGIAVRRLLEASRPCMGRPDLVCVERMDWDRLNALATDLP